MKRLLLVVLAGAMALVLSSCFTLQSFTLQNGALKRGQTTKATIVVRPSSTQKGPFSKLYQFVLVGVDTPDDIAIQNAKWDGKKTFGPVQNMPVSGAIATSIGADCDDNGFVFASISGVTWKGFISLNPIADKQLVTKTAAITVGLKAKMTASHHDVVNLIVLTGGRLDDGDGIVNAGDSFLCSGNASTSVLIK